MYHLMETVSDQRYVLSRRSRHLSSTQTWNYFRIWLIVIGVNEKKRVCLCPPELRYKHHTTIGICMLNTREGVCQLIKRTEIKNIRWWVAIGNKSPATSPYFLHCIHAITCSHPKVMLHVNKKGKVTSLNDYHPIALMSVAMKCFERLVMAHINTIMP